MLSFVMFKAFKAVHRNSHHVQKLNIHNLNKNKVKKSNKVNQTIYKITNKKQYRNRNN